MKRSPIRPKPRRNRPVVDWDALRAEVELRDLHQMWLASKERAAGIIGAELFGRYKRPICVAPIIDSEQQGKCWGRTTLDHIKDEPRLGVKAEDEPDNLVSICQGHGEDGRKAGYQWNTAHRTELRKYLRDVSGKSLSTG